MRYVNVMIAVFAGILMVGSGCRKESVPTAAPSSSEDEPAHSCAASVSRREEPLGELSPQELQVRQKLEKTSNWRAYLEAASGNTHIGSQISQDINRISDPTRRMKCFRRFFETAFSFPIDATDPETRGDQLFAFCEYSESVSSCAYHRNDQDNFWETRICRLRRLKEESQKLSNFFNGRGNSDTFKGGRESWREYRSYLEGEYARSKRATSQFGTLQTADFLTFERWLSIRSQLEDVVGHEVKVWDVVLEKWKKQHKEIPTSVWAKQKETKHAKYEREEPGMSDEERRRGNADVKVDTEGL